MQRRSVSVGSNRGKEQDVRWAVIRGAVGSSALSFWCLEFKFVVWNTESITYQFWIITLLNLYVMPDCKLDHIRCVLPPGLNKCVQVERAVTIQCLVVLCVSCFILILCHVLLFTSSFVCFPPRSTCSCSPPSLVSRSIYPLLSLMSLSVRSVFLRVPPWCQPACILHQYLLQCLPVVCFRFLLLEFPMICTLLVFARCVIDSGTSHFAGLVTLKKKKGSTILQLLLSQCSLPGKRITWRFSYVVRPQRITGFKPDPLPGGLLGTQQYTI